MKVRCVSTALDIEQVTALGLPSKGVILDDRLSVGEQYLVIGLTFELGAPSGEAGVYVHLLLPDGDLASSNLYLFEVIDPRVSRYWEARIVKFAGEQYVELLPPSLFDLLNTTETDVRSSRTQEHIFATGIHSAEFQRVYDLLRLEY